MPIHCVIQCQVFTTHTVLNTSILVFQWLIDYFVFHTIQTHVKLIFKHCCKYWNTLNNIYYFWLISNYQWSVHT